MRIPKKRSVHRDLLESLQVVVVFLRKIIVLTGVLRDLLLNIPLPMKRVIFQILVLVCVCGVAHPQNMDMGTGMEISGFRVPDYDEQGELRAQLYGEHAKVLEGGEVEITNLKIEMYRDGEVVMTVFSPHCFFNMETRKARSEGRVLIDSGMMTIVGRGFTWSAEAGRFEILHESKVLVKEAAQSEMRGLEL